MFKKSVVRLSVRLISLVVTALIVAGCDKSDDTPVSSLTGPPAYVGSQVCSTCHLAEFERWQDSHHALAMQAANADTVLGDFSGTEIEHFGQLSAFYEDNGTY